jgi:excisionase family DNA binding protein
MNERYITVAEAAKILNIHPRTVTKYLITGQLRGAKMGRIWRLDEKDIRAFFEAIKDETTEAIKSKGGISNDS